MTTRPVDTASTGDLTEVFYPETDGMPLADGYFQDPIFREVLSIFELYYSDSPSTAVSGNTIIYYEEGNPRRWMSPDCYIALDVSMESIEKFNTYRIWKWASRRTSCLRSALRARGIQTSSVSGCYTLSWE